MCLSEVLTCHAFLCLVGEPAVEALNVVLGHGLEDALQSTVFMLIVTEPSILLCFECIEGLR